APVIKIRLPAKRFCWNTLHLRPKRGPLILTAGFGITQAKVWQNRVFPSVQKQKPLPLLRQRQQSRSELVRSSASNQTQPPVESPAETPQSQAARGCGHGRGRWSR